MPDKDENVGWSEDVTMITIEAISKRGKQLIKQYGDRWWLCRIDESLQCFDGSGGVLIAPKGRAWHSHSSRFVRASDWLKWHDNDLRVSAQSLLDNIEMARFKPTGT